MQSYQVLEFTQQIWMRPASQKLSKEGQQQRKLDLTSNIPLFSAPTKLTALLS